MNNQSTFLAFASVFFVATASAACPPINGITDFNCDGQLKMSFMGDSVPYGFGDDRNNGQGGYVLRLERVYQKGQLFNFGEPGAHSGPYLRTWQRVVSETDLSEKANNLLSSDVVVIDLGRNDRWEFGLPSATYRNLKRLAAVIKSSANKNFGSAPMVVIADMMLPNRGSQGPWVKELDAFILKGSTTSQPGDLRFDLVSKRLLNTDQIHPTSLGYDALAKTFVAYMKKVLVPRMNKLRPDKDGNGVPDIFDSLPPTPIPTSTPAATPTDMPLPPV